MWSLQAHAFARLYKLTVTGDAVSEVSDDQTSYSARYTPFERSISRVAILAVSKGVGL